MKDKRVLALITARKGSKRLPGKNIRILGDIPLLAWTIRAAKQSKCIDRLILSTDDPNAILTAKAEGCEVPFLRPSELARDESSSYEVAAHALEALEEQYDWLILLQPTSPFRTTQDIDESMQLMLRTNKNSLLSVCQADKSHLMYFMLNENRKLISPCGISIASLNHMRSQEMPIPYEINGAIYIVNVRWFLREKRFFDDDTIAYVMPSARSINIDTEEDWAWAEMQLLTKHQHQSAGIL